ncbi:MAG: heme-binding protein [Planctomycetota bacterium]
MLKLSVCVLPLLAAATSAQVRLLDAADVPARKAAATKIERVIDAQHDLATTVALAATSGASLPAGSRARAVLGEALRRANQSDDAERAVSRLRLDLGELVDTLTFRPVDEAEVPKGFPVFAGLDEIELRTYPAYRMARTAMKGSGSNGAFWPLFNHIKDNGIAMTSPVQMDYDDDGERAASMAFLYGDPSMDPSKVADNVEVVDVPAATVLSIGANGYERKGRVAAMEQRLRDFVRSTRGAWVVAGPLRTMAYNSPMVRGDRRYFEVQLPVRRADGKQAQREQAQK